MNLTAIQKALADFNLDGWLFFDHHGRDPLSYRILGLNAEHVCTRRWYYFIPKVGEPKALVHRIEPNSLNALPGTKLPYSSWSEQASMLKQILAGAKTVAMQYSPKCNIPYIALVDAGTVELVRGAGVEVVSSADLVQLFEARLSPEDFASHLEAGRLMDKIRAEAFNFISAQLAAKAKVSEFQVKELILKRMIECGLVTDHGPIVAVNANASNPHYEPSAATSLDINPGDFVLIDMWAKLNKPGAIYYDITWTGFCGKEPTPEMKKVFEVVRDARDAGVKFVQEAVKSGKQIRGCDVDDVVRGAIVASGYGDYIVHRTGHSLGQEVHGNGANMDNLETHDERRIIPETCFTIEPGVYLKHFGVRSEINLWVDKDGARTTGEVQRELVLLGTPASSRPATL